MSEIELEILLKDLQSLNKECEYVEFKVGKYIPQQIGEYLSALSNGAAYVGQPYGNLVFGIEDGTHRLVGTDFKPRETQVHGQELELWLTINLNPRISFDIFEFEYNELSFVIFRVQRMRSQPVCFNGTPYIRIGSHKAKLYEHPERARKLWAQDSDLVFERELCKFDVDEETLFQAIDTQNFFNLLNLPYPNDTAAIIHRLIQEQVIKSGETGFHVTNLGALLFAREISFFDDLGRRALKVIKYNGNGRTTAEKETLARKGYAVGFDGLIKYIEDRLPTSEVIVRTTRTQVDEYPIIAIREIVANALIHQDFSIKGMTPKVEIFDNRTTWRVS
ncbi:MAG: transcriptional regulator, partial [Sphingobacteriaceae bacterium]